MRRLIHLALLIGALGWAGWILVHADLPGAWHTLQRNASGIPAGWLIIAFLAPYALNGWFDTHGWILTFGTRRPNASFARLYGIRLAGEALNQATPFMSLGGEPVKALLLEPREADRADSAASVAVARVVITMAQVSYVAIGMLLSIPTLWQTHRVVLLRFGVFPAAIGVLLVVVLASRLFVPRRWQTALLNHPRLAPHRDAFQVIRQVLDFWRQHPRQCASAFGCFLCAWAVVALEFMIVARALGRNLPWEQALALEGLMNSITMATFFIPGNLGSQEAGLIYLSALFGLSAPFGALMVVLRRMREVIWIAIGFVCLAVQGSRVGLGPLRGPAGVAHGEAP